MNGAYGSSALCVMDPTSLGKNVASSSYLILEVLDLFREVFIRIQEFKEQLADSLQKAKISEYQTLSQIKMNQKNTKELLGLLEQDLVRSVLFQEKPLEPQASENEKVREFSSGKSERSTNDQENEKGVNTPMTKDSVNESFLSQEPTPPFFSQNSSMNKPKSEKEFDDCSKKRSQPNEKSLTKQEENHSFKPNPFEVDGPKKARNQGGTSSYNANSSKGVRKKRYSNFNQCESYFVKSEIY